MGVLKHGLLIIVLGGLVALGLALAQEGEGGPTIAEPSSPSYGPGTVPTIPGTDVPVPAGEGAGSAPAEGEPPGEAPGLAPAEEGGGAGGGAGASAGGGSPGTYVERRKDQVVFESACLKCHPKEKILKRRTEAKWKEIVLQKHLLQGRIFSSDAAPVLRYLNQNYGINPPGTAPAAPGSSPPAAGTVSPGAPAAPAAGPSSPPPAPSNP